MLLKQTLLFVYISTRLWCVDSQTTARFKLEAEDAKGKHRIVHRSNASGGKTVSLNNGEAVTVNFCLRIGSNVTLSQIMYSNDGDEDTLVVSVDDTRIGQFNSRGHSNFGHLWNHFMVWNLKRHLYLESGWHVLQFANIRKGIVEIDCFLLDISDRLLHDNIFNCVSICIDTKSVTVSSDYAVSSGVAIQRSYPSLCAEEDNVNIPLFHPNIQKFRLTASLPKHGSFRNYRTQDTTNCPHLPPTLWEFTNFTINALSEPIVNGPATLIFDRQRMSGSLARLVLLFRLKGKSFGLIDSEIGSILTFKFRSLSGWAKVGMEFHTKAGVYTEPDERLFDKDTLEQSWSFPDFTWTENDMNFILLTIETDFERSVFIEMIKMMKRTFLPEKVETLYSSDNLIIESVTANFWWLAPESMTVSLANGKRWTGVSYIRFYRPVPWGKGFAQVFVLYQDGNIRLLPLPPDGIDWIPFGTSVIVGQTNPVDKRPHSSIDQVNINPEFVSIDVVYKNGGSALMVLESSIAESTLTVSEIKRTPNITSPFATFRSMYLNMSKACADHVVSDEGHSFPVLGQWKTFTGKTFLLLHTCSSTYLSLSPDIKIEIMETTKAGAINETQHDVASFLDEDDGHDD